MKRPKNFSAITEDNPSMSVKRRRDVNAGRNLRSRPNSKASKSACRSVPTPPATPTRSEKHVQLSDPRSEIVSDPNFSSITPFMSRTTLQTTPPPSRHCSTPATLSNRRQYGVPMIGVIQFKSMRQTLSSRTKRRLRRNGLSEELNNIQWEERREVKHLRAEIERLKIELAAKCAEIEIMREKEYLGDEERLGDPITTDTNLSTRVHELEQQIRGLKAELQQKEVESDSFENADSVMASKGLLTFNEDNNQLFAPDDSRESMVHNNIISTPNSLNTSFLSPPPTIPDTPSRNLRSKNTRFIKDAHAIGAKERRQATKWAKELVPQF